MPSGFLPLFKAPHRAQQLKNAKKKRINCLVERVGRRRRMRKIQRSEGKGQQDPKTRPYCIGRRRNLATRWRLISLVPLICPQSLRLQYLPLRTPTAFPRTNMLRVLLEPTCSDVRLQDKGCREEESPPPNELRGHLHSTCPTTTTATVYHLFAPLDQFCADLR